MENNQHSNSSASTNAYTDVQNNVLDREREHLGIKDTEPVRAFAISGGGIRSASFGMGVMQALVANDELKKDQGQKLWGRRKNRRFAAEKIRTWTNRTTPF